MTQTKFRVVAHAMHEHEIAEASAILANPQATEAFVVGEADETQIEKLRSAGLIIEKLSAVGEGGSTASPETPGQGTQFLPEKRRSITFAAPKATPQSIAKADAELDLTRPNVFLLQIAGPLLAENRAKLEAAGVQLIESFRNGFYSALLSPAQASAVATLDFVSGVQLYDVNQTVAGAAGGPGPLESGAPRAVGAKAFYDVMLHREDDLAEVLAWLRRHNVSIVGNGRSKIRIEAPEDAPILTEIRGLNAVRDCADYVEPKLFNDRARALMKIEPQSAPVFAYDGAGQIVAVADTGLDEQHPDFAGRIVDKVALGRPGKSDDPNGHGTHVAGSILGDGSASNGVFRGIAPAARLYFQSLIDDRGRLGGLPIDLIDLFEPAYAAGARIHNNSWGAATASTYAVNAREVDDFVFRRRDMLIVIAAGNEGSAINRANTPAGVVDWLSIGSPATAKNALTVGASRSDRSSGGLSEMTWSEWNGRFPDPPQSTEKVSGDPESLAGFSSRGPSDDRRIKPDIVAPGTDIVSTRSSSGNDATFWALHSNARYAFMGGTSMATPLVSGCAALIRQFYVQARNHEPSSALLRATIINGARKLTGRDANASNPAGTSPAGNFDQGFGAVDMSATIPNTLRPHLRLAFADNWKNKAEQLLNTGDRRRYLVQVDGGEPLHITLAYTDAPRRGLQNNLNLFVQAPDNSKFIGNAVLHHSLNRPDGDNNVEIVRIENPSPGAYLIQVTANNLLHPPQDFALVVTGRLGADALQKI